MLSGLSDSGEGVLHRRIPIRHEKSGKFLLNHDKGYQGMRRKRLPMPQIHARKCARLAYLRCISPRTGKKGLPELRDPWPEHNIYDREPRFAIMKYEVKYKPAYSLLVVSLNPGESIAAGAGSMTYIQPTLEVRTRKREKGFWGSLGLTLIGGQSFFVNDFTAENGSGEAAFSSAPLGDIDILEITPARGYIIQKTAYVASEDDVDLDIQWQGFTKGLFGQGLFMIKVTGSGLIFINTFGAIDRHTLAAGESLIVDNHHLVAFSDTCQYTVTKFGGLKETILGGEGLVTEISGPGDIYIQTKNIRELADWIWTIIEPRIQSKAR